MTTPHPLAETVQVLAFDIFGTVVDWHGSIAREMAQLHPQVDGDVIRVPIPPPTPITLMMEDCSLGKSK